MKHTCALAVLVLLVIKVGGSSYAPFDEAEPFVLKLKGGGELAWSGANDESYLFQAYNDRSGYAQTLYRYDDRIVPLFTQGPQGRVNYVFMTYKGSEDQLDMIEQRMLQGLMATPNMTAARAAEWKKRLHFVEGAIEGFDNWIPALLDQWQSSLLLVNASVHGTSEQKHSFTRVDPNWPNIMAPGPVNVPLPVAWIPDGCKRPFNGSLPWNVTGKVALIARSPACTYSRMIYNAAEEGAVAALVYSLPDTPIINMNCEICILPLTIGATMISNEDGMILVNALHDPTVSKVTVTFSRTATGSYGFAIDHAGTLQSLGYDNAWPSFAFYGWEAAYLQFEQDQVLTPLQRIHNNMNGLVIFDRYTNQQTPVPTNISLDTVSMETRKNYKLWLDFSIGCETTFDSSCPAWDRIVEFNVCCNRQDDLCGLEFFRAITPFARAIGHWLIDATDMAPMLMSGDECSFTVGTNTNENWVFSANLLWDLSAPLEEPVTSMTPLWNRRISFNSGFNNLTNIPISFMVPPKASKVFLTAVLSGHGSDNHQCAEFCNTKHRFLVNDQYNNTHQTFHAGSPYGSAVLSGFGSEPNSYGTWFYGRDLWAYKNVVEHRWDITDQVNFDSTNTIAYFGYWCRTDEDCIFPNPTEGGASIVVNTRLVFYSQKN